jgi:hypothetical protein
MRVDDGGASLSSRVQEFKGSKVKSGVARFLYKFGRVDAQCVCGDGPFDEESGDECGNTDSAGVCG